MSFPTGPTPPPPSPNQPPMPPVTAEPAGPGLSEFQRIINVFIAPSKTFADLKRNPSWWVPWLLICLFGTAYIVTIDKKIGYEAIMDARMAHATPFMQRAIDQMTPEQKQNMRESQLKGSRRGIYLGPIFVLIYGLLAAAVLT